MSTTQTTNTNDPNNPETEQAVMARVAEKNAAMTPEQAQELAQKARAWQMPTEQVQNGVNSELSQVGIGHVEQDRVNAVVAANHAAGEHGVQDIANQVIASEAADQLMSGTSQATVDGLYDKYGGAVVEAKNIIRDGAGDYGTLKTAGDIIGASTAPEKTADEARAELTVKAQEGELSGRELETAEVLGVETEKVKDDDGVEGIERQITELHEKMQADNEGGVIQFEDIQKMSSLKDKLLELKVESMSGATPDAAVVAKIDDDISEITETVAALEAQAKKIAELAERELQEAA